MTTEDFSCLSLTVVVSYFGSSQWTLPIRIHVLCGPLPLDLAYELLSPREHSRSDAAQVLKLSFKKAWQLLLLYSQSPELPFKKLSYPAPKDHAKRPHGRVAQRSRVLDNTWRKTEELTQRRIKTGAPDLSPMESHSNWAPHLWVKRLLWVFWVYVVRTPDLHHCEKIKFILSY